VARRTRRPAFAGNVSLISPEKLVESGFLAQSDLDETTDLAPGPVDLAKVESHKRRLLERAFHTFRDRLQADGDLRSDYAAVIASLSTWLEDYALYAALKDAHEGSEWCSWSAELAMREQDAIAQARRDLAERIEEQRFFQYLFFRQWLDLRRHANQAGVRILGDLPLFVAHDSADVWSRPHLWQLRADGRPVVVAGVPPDAFSSTGQRWGNPLYAWERLREDGFTCWVDRMRETLKLVDVVRLDHFRGFAACWEVPAEDATAENGRWAEVPGSELFGAISLTLRRPAAPQESGPLRIRSIRRLYELAFRAALRAAAERARGPFVRTACFAAAERARAPRFVADTRA
jgi:4-alpha-glucanotransferase